MSTTTRFLVALLVVLAVSIPGIATAKQLSDEDLFAAAQLVDSDIIGDTLAFMDGINLDGSDVLAPSTTPSTVLAAPAHHQAGLTLLAETSTVSGGTNNVLDDDDAEAKAKGPDLDNIQDGPQNGPDIEKQDGAQDGPDVQDGPEDAD